MWINLLLLFVLEMLKINFLIGDFKKLKLKRLKIKKINKIKFVII